MKLRPQNEITERELRRGMSFIVRDGVSTELMNAFSGGTFLVALAVLLGASNFQIGFLAGLPTLMNIFQLFSIWLVRKFNNRRVTSMTCSFFARLPILIIGVLASAIPGSFQINSFIFFLCVYYFFASIAAPAWNAWMKDLVPEERLGSFFSHRSMLSQIVNAGAGLSLALLVDYIRVHYPSFQLSLYGYMYIVAGICGLCGVFFLSQTPEPASRVSNENIFKLLARPLKDPNFKRLLIFNSAWLFAINIATPFFTVYMLKTLGLPLSYIIGLTIITQVSSILTVRLWGSFSDRYSNKTILAIASPLYILCIITWCFVGLFNHMYVNISLIAVINMFSGIATAGINLSLVNIGLKLAPREDGIVYLSARNIVTALFSAIAPMTGGYLADFFAKRHLDLNATYSGPTASGNFHLLSLHQFNFLFVIGAGLAVIAVQLLARVKEKGEVEKDVVVRIMRSSMRNNMKDYFIIGTLIDWRQHVSSRITKIFKPEKELQKK